MALLSALCWLLHLMMMTENYPDELAFPVSADEMGWNCVSVNCTHVKGATCNGKDKFQVL